jgi:hypothetical protein
MSFFLQTRRLFKRKLEQQDAKSMANGTFSLPEGVLTAGSFQAALDLLASRSDVADIFVCGGARVYTEALQHAGCQQVYLTRVHQHVPDATAHFPKMFSQEVAVISAAGWRRCTHTEFQTEMAQRCVLPATDTKAMDSEEHYPEGVLQDEKSGLAFEFQLFTRYYE